MDGTGMHLALFDFDGTVTSRDTMLEFIRFAGGRSRVLLGMGTLWPFGGLYLIDGISSQKFTEILMRFFFRGMTQEQVRQLGEEFARSRLPRLVRRRALDRIRWHQENGHRVVVVSASFDVWLKPWCDQNGLELLASQFEIRQGRLTGRFEGKECSGPEKVRRIESFLNLDEYSRIYAYGDSRSDKPMLELAHESYFGKVH